MSGILDNKQRFVDSVITAEGRRQLAAGEFKIEFASFSDADVFYQADPVSGSIDLSQLIQLEAPSDLPTDKIVLESNLFGDVIATAVAGVSSANGQPISVMGGKVVQFSGASKNIITGSAYKAIAASIISASLSNYKSLSPIATEDPFLSDQKLKISRREITFEITDRNVDNYCSLPVADISRDAESLFQDRHLSHLPNYKYLPPRNKPTPQDPEGKVLFDYPDNSQADIITLQDYENEVRFLPRTDIEFTNTSRENNVVCQVYETSGEKLNQLVAIDFGEFVTNDPQRPTKRVYFIGKLYPKESDKFGNETYVNMFTLEFD